MPLQSFCYGDLHCVPREMNVGMKDEILPPFVGNNYMRDNSFFTINILTEIILEANRYNLAFIYHFQDFGCTVHLIFNYCYY